MYRQCLNREILNRLIEVELDGKALYDDEDNLRLLIDSWKCWEVELICIIPSLLQILENRQKRSEDTAALLNRFYSFYRNAGYLLHIEQLDQTFIEYMFRFVRRADLTIEQDLLEIRQSLSEHRYPR